MDDIKNLIIHIQDGIIRASAKESKLTQDILNLPGMASYKNRHLLNNLLNMPNVNYLEIGTYRGSTFISSLYENNVDSAIAIDNWSEFGGFGNKNIFTDNCKKFNIENYVFFDEDSFTLDLNNIKNKINVYFYDGAHQEEFSYAAIKYYYDVFADTFILIVDDYDWDIVRTGIQNGIKDCNLNVIYEKHLKSDFCGDVNTWWNGLYVALIKK